MQFICIALHLALVLQASAALATSFTWKSNLEEGNKRIQAQDLPGAEACFRQAVRMVRKSGASADNVSMCFTRLADVLEMEDLTQEALPFYNKALHTLEKAYGKNSVNTLPTLLTLGSVFQQETEYPKAIKIFTRASKIANKSFGPESLEYARCLHQLGLTEFQAGSAKQAEDFYRLALSISMSQKKLPSPDFLQDLLSDYINLLSNLSEPEKIISSDFEKELLRDQIGSLAKTQGIPSSSWQAHMKERMANQSISKAISGEILSPPSAKDAFQHQTKDSLNHALRDFSSLDKVNKQHIEFYERLIAIDINSLGANHPSVARDLSGLASFYLQLNRYDDAQPLLERALQIYSVTYGDNAAIVKRTQSLINLIAEEKVQDLGNKAIVNQYLNGLPNIPIEAQKLEIALRLNNLALLCFSHNRLADSAKIYQWALADIALCCGKQNTLAASCMTDYSHLLRQTGNQEEAERLEVSAHNILKQSAKRKALESLP